MAKLHIEVDIDISEYTTIDEVMLMAEDMDVLPDENVYNDFIIHMPYRTTELLGDVSNVYWDIRD